MDGLRAAIQAFSIGELSLAELTRRLDAYVAVGYGADEQALAALREAAAAGQLAPAAFQQLSGRVPTPVAGGAATNAPRPDDTLLRRTPSQPAPDPARRPLPPAGMPARPTAVASPAGPRGTASPSLTDIALEDPFAWTGVWGTGVEPGDRLSERYLLERQLGEGGMGTVYLAHDEIEGESFAVKVLKPDFREHPDSLRALQEEVRKSRALAHPHIVGVYSLNRDHTNVYMLMEYLEGKTLDALLDDDFARGMPFASAWPHIQGVGAALAYAHDRGVIHSDLKPSNIFLTTGGKAKVLDFGISRAARGRSKRFDPGELGALTPAYASGEMLAGEPPDVRDDVYAFACVVYEVLSGKHPFARRSAVEARDARMKPAPLTALSAAQNAALVRALAFERDKRTPSVEAFLEGLRQTGMGRARSISLGVSAVALLAALGVGGWYGWGYVQRSKADAAFVESLLKPNADRPDDYDPALIKELLEQGDDGVRLSEKSFDPGTLTEGVSTAYGAYVSVLKLDPASRAAAEGILRILKLYKAEARRLSQERQYKRALELVQIGLRIHRTDPELIELRDELVPKAGAMAAGA